MLAPTPSCNNTNALSLSVCVSLVVLAAGVATTTITRGGNAGIIEIVKAGDGSVVTACFDEYYCCRWGDYTAMSVVDGDRVWFSTTRATQVAGPTMWYGSWISSKGLGHGGYDY